VSASVNLPLHHKVQKFSSGTGSPGWSRKKGRMEVRFRPGCFVLDGDPAPPPKKKGHSPQFSAMSIVAKWLDGSRCHLVGRWALAQATLCWMGPSSSQKGHSPPIFGPCLLWPNSWMDQAATWYRGRPRPRRHCVRWGPSYPPHPKRGTALPIFRRKSVVDKCSRAGVSKSVKNL